MLYSLKNVVTRVEAEAFGYSWQILATRMAQEMPPRKPREFEYMFLSEEKR